MNGDHLAEAGKRLQHGPMFTCGWCRTTYAEWASKCPNCGGSLPGDELGPEPPAPPRRLPGGFAFHHRFSGNIQVIVGLGFMFAGSTIGAVMWQASTMAAVVPGLAGLGGLAMFWKGMSQANRMLRAFRSGHPVKARIASVEKESGRHKGGRPWVIVSQFEFKGEACTHVLHTWEPSTAQRFRSYPLTWLLVTDSPRSCAFYPPAK